MDKPAIRQCLLYPIAALLMLPIFGCSRANLFRGRLILMNSTGGEIRSVTVANVHPGVNQAFDLPELADGRAWVRDCGADNLIVVGDLTLSYLDHAGTTRVHKIPFADVIPGDCDDDFSIEIGRDDPPRAGLLAYRNGLAHTPSAVMTHALTGAACLLLGWLIGHRGRGPAALPGHPVKSMTPEI
jgi:hypothetical protein